MSMKERDCGKGIKLPEQNSIGMRNNTDTYPTQSEQVKKQSRIVWGSSTGESDTTFAAAARRMSLYVGKAHKDVSENQIELYLKSKFKKNEFIITPLQAHNEATS